MVYNPYSAVNAIYNLKGDWDSANNANDAKKKNDAAAKAQKYYNELRKNGYDNVADELTAANYANAKNIRDKWAKTGKTATRDYLYSRGNAKGLSQNDIDKLISWDDQTGEISFGGKKIGKPDAVVNGTSYWGDTSKLDNAFDDYISRSGATANDEKMSSLNTAGVYDKLNSLWGMQKDDRSKYTSEYDKTAEMIRGGMTNSDDYKAAFNNIMPEYTLKAMEGRDNEIASGAGTNAGNVDSFTAANALRQQAALTAKGQALAHQMGSEAWQAKVQNARALLADLGVYQKDSQVSMRDTISAQQNEAQRLSENVQTEKNNDIENKSKIAAVTGYTPADWSIQNDTFIKQFLDESGRIKPEFEKIDFQERINDAKARGDNELAKKYAILRGMKIFGNYSDYGRYLNQGDIAYAQPQKTEPARQFDEQISQADRALNAEQSNNEADRQLRRDLADRETQSATVDNFPNVSGGTETYKPKLTASQAMTAIKNGEKSQAVIDAYNYHYDTNYTVDNPPNVSGSTSGGNSSASDSNGSSNSSDDKGLIINLKMLKALRSHTAPSSVLSEFFRDKNISADRAIKIARQAGFTDDEIAEYDLSPYK